MPIITQYVVEKNGVNLKTFTNKKDADAYDKMLEIAEQMETYLLNSDIELKEKTREDIAFLMVEQKEDVILLLKGSKKIVKKSIEKMDN